MCGIVGYLGGDPVNFESSNLLLRRMTDQIITRGPDSAGTWLDASSKVALGHRRLAVVDLSVSGSQPMTSHSNRYVMSYNGEIYNNAELRDKLLATGVQVNWRGQSDTETLLAGFDAWGIKDTVNRATGMFALAIWDKLLNQLTLVRDRLGEKPLYYGWQESGSKNVFLFGSELKSFKLHPQFCSEIDRGSLALYMRYSYVPTPYSIYKGIKKLEPGTILTVSLKENSHSKEKYWDSLDVIMKGAKCSFQGTATEISNNLDSVLRKAVSQQMMADVPLGAFLSGGIDSSTVVALMQAESIRPVKTFTVGFNEVGYNEAKFAKLVAKHLGTEHNELYVSSQDALSVIPKLPKIYCEPFADSSQIPTFLVSSLARKSVTVSLSGDGGDELFCGYNRYLYADNLWRNLSRVPSSLRGSISKALNSIPVHLWEKTFSLVDHITPPKFNGVGHGNKLLKGLRVMGAEDISSLYKGLVSNWQNPSSIVIRGREHDKLFSTDINKLTGMNDIIKMMAVDMISYLPDDILVKVDRAAMGVSLETRVPFLDHYVFEFASKIPLSMKKKNGVGKSILRDVLYRYVPKELIERPKMGFGVPIADWLRGPLKDWAEELLDETRLSNEGFFYPKTVRDMWSEHLSGRRNWQSQLWAVLMFQAWLEDNL